MLIHPKIYIFFFPHYQHTTVGSHFFFLAIVGTYEGKLTVFQKNLLFFASLLEQAEANIETDFQIVAFFKFFLTVS
ncbi:MAG: hypothetical protein SFV55_00515 [Haliscomenobacter sp.]|uniref:hypothetical protein n=1 Tax=Haliscomenobacter sp. TaxID=2717303 RepID=UPI0029B5E461|nr:hypothetical protein [Haliscomenobacter sp.]MDX2066870.1 hypothetical protein [Haliscomenobacter sp.]